MQNIQSNPPSDSRYNKREGRHYGIAFPINVSSTEILIL